MSKMYSSYLRTIQNILIAYLAGSHVVIVALWATCFFFFLLLLFFVGEGAGLRSSDDGDSNLNKGMGVK